MVHVYIKALAIQKHKPIDWHNRCLQICVTLYGALLFVMDTDISGGTHT